MEGAKGVLCRELNAFIARLRPPPALDSDADLLDRYVQTADGTSFAGIVRRHGSMVLSVCERRLGCHADAEDAFQAVFLALATSAASIGRRSSLPAWLYRVAYLTALKAAGRRERHSHISINLAEMQMPEQPLTTWETIELKAVIDAEVAGLPDRLRAVVVLCLIEGRTNAEAASLMGVPTGTIDSRLSTARKQLRARLTRRGVAVGLSITLENMLGGPLEAAGPRLLDLVSHTIPAVLIEAAQPGAGAVTPAVADLARRISMTTNVRFLVTLSVTLGLVGGAAGIYLATAGDKSSNPVATASDTKSPPDAEAKSGVNKTSVAGDPIATFTEAKPGEPGSGIAALNKVFDRATPPEGIALSEILEAVEKQTDLMIRVDIAAFRRLDPDGEVGNDPDVFLKKLYETKAFLPQQAGKMPMRDVLTDALAQVRHSHPCTYQVRGSQLVIVPAFVPPVRPGADPLSLHPDNGGDGSLVSPTVLNEQVYGGIVTVLADRKPLAEVLADLRKQTGANIVFDPRCEVPEKKAILTVTLSDVRLYDALRVITDMAELKLVYFGNIYYVTTPANAKMFQTAVPRSTTLPGPR